ncbi:RNA polymerase III subunit C82 [Dissophora ornata]|nr:RNA polymerase III subunit C82 [Dissophora ornata]
MPAFAGGFELNRVNKPNYHENSWKKKQNLLEPSPLFIPLSFNFDSSDSAFIHRGGEYTDNAGANMSTHENRLCRLIVREHFGPIVEKVANVLLRKGRMPVGLIASITNIKPRQVRECLLVMIQHNIAVYAEAQEKNRIVTYYEVNRTELLHRSMIPKVLRYSREWFEKDGGLVAQAILTHGKLTIEDCLKEILTDTTTARTQVQRTQSIKKAFTKMVKEKCLIAVRPSDSLTAADKAMAEEKRETDKMTLPPTAAELANIRRTLGAQKVQDQTNAIIGLKRTLETGDNEFEGDKRRRLMVDDDLKIVEDVETDVYFKINYDRFIIRWRNMQIAELYEVRLNATAKNIMNTILTLAEERMINVKEDFSNPVNIMLLLNNLPTDINLVETLEFDLAELGASGVKPKMGECLEKYVQILEDDLMQILKKDAGRSGQYIISLKMAARILKRNLIQNVVASRFGSPYVRIMNMLLEKGKLEEKQISRYSMMPVKDVREKLTTLCTFGVLNLQEVPKTNDRTPSRTFYLWEVLLDRAASALVDRLYHTMANLRQRRFVERSKRAVLLEKCERTDVREDDSLLNPAEKKELETLNSVLEMLEIQELRIAEMVVTLKEF